MGRILKYTYLFVVIWQLERDKPDLSYLMLISTTSPTYGLVNAVASTNFLERIAAIGDFRSFSRRDVAGADHQAR